MINYWKLSIMLDVVNYGVFEFTKKAPAGGAHTLKGEHRPSVHVGVV